MDMPNMVNHIPYTVTCTSHSLAGISQSRAVGGHSDRGPTASHTALPCEVTVTEVPLHSHTASPCEVTVSTEFPQALLLQHSAVSFKGGRKADLFLGSCESFMQNETNLLPP